jgi:hypothetical protein
MAGGTVPGGRTYKYQSVIDREDRVTRRAGSI